ncbi:MAG: hypothetical protein DRO52_05575 [Candidatus Hecatellales archaeon]|nr:MAG: hypothetical protein DRO52_05575 [Candidatus Hecatellales archaeon]
MGYASLEMVKERLGLDPSDTSRDEVLQAKIASADAFIDNLLKPYVEVPLANPPQMVRDASADLAAALFEEDRLAGGGGSQDKIHVWRRRALEALEAYIRETFGGYYTSTESLKGGGVG